MSAIGVDFLSFRFEYPAKEPPLWKEAVERWYQLDAYAYGLAQAYTTWKPRLKTLPALILLASPQASNETDYQFATTGASSPAKFVHTLPNIRSSSLCQVMGWAGPVLCLQKDPVTLVHALREAAALLDSGGAGPIWVLGVFRLPADVPTYEAQAFVLQTAAGNIQYEIAQASQAGNPKADGLLHEWINSSDSGAFPLPGGYELRKIAQ